MKEIFKLNLKRNISKYIKYGTIILSIVAFIFVFVYLTKADFNITQEFKVIDSKVDNFDSDYMISAYIDDVKQDNFPSPNQDIKFKSITCNKAGVNAYFDEGSWSAVINTTSKNTRCSVYFETDNDAWKLPGGVDLETGMLPIVFDGDTIKVADTTSKWYDYRESKWANAALVGSASRSKTAGEVLSMDEIRQMYVWIPRYAYKVWPKENNQSNEQMINIIFQSNLSKDTESGYITHPAFTYGDTILNGFWVGKFEPTSDLGIQTTSNELSTNAKYIKILPNRISITNNNVYNLFTASLDVQNRSPFGIDSATTETRMMKNIEWGAISYLTQSRYGLYNSNGTCKNESQATENGCEVFINNVNVGYGNETNNNSVSFQWGPTVTGCSAKSSDADVYNTHNETNPTCESGYSWNENGVLASTTGNIYGIYDMSGGAWEYVMGNTGTDATKYNFYSVAAGFDGSYVPNDKYYDKYVGSSVSSSKIHGITGDATSEVVKNYSNNLNGGWNGDSSFFVGTREQWFARGGSAKDKSRTGIFAFSSDTGRPEGAISFRIVLSKE